MGRFFVEPILSVRSLDELVRYVQAQFRRIAEAIGYLEEGRDIKQRTKVTSNLTVYVDGSNSSTGDGTEDNPFQTIQEGIDSLVGDYDLGEYTGTVSVASGTYSENVELKTPQPAGATCTLSGDTTTPSNVVISSTAECVTLRTIGDWTAKGFQATTDGSTGNGDCFVASGPGARLALEDIEIDGCETGRSCFYASALCSFCVINTTVNITSNLSSLDAVFKVINMAWMDIEGTTLDGESNTVSYDDFVDVEGGSFLEASNMTFSNVAGFTGNYYSANINSAIDTGGGGGTYFPGNAAGTTNNDSVYV